jgi:hypothetical protein
MTDQRFMRPSGLLAGISAAGFGFEASIGAARAHETLRALEGLTEGFRKL